MRHAGGRSRRGWAALTALWPGAAAAQSGDVPAVISPLRVETDHNNVNLTTGRTTIEPPALSIPAAPNLRFDRVQNAAPYVKGSVSGAAGDLPVGNYSVHTGGGASESFRCSDTLDCESVTASGSTFRPVGLNSFRYQQAGSGAIWTFNLKHVNSTAQSPRTILYYASQIAYPNGEVISFDYGTTVDNGLTYLPPRHDRQLDGLCDIDHLPVLDLRDARLGDAGAGDAGGHRGARHAAGPAHLQRQYGHRSRRPRLHLHRRLHQRARRDCGDAGRDDAAAGRGGGDAERRARFGEPAADRHGDARRRRLDLHL